MPHAHYSPHDVADPYGGYPAPRKKPYLLYALIAIVVLGGLCCVGSCIPLAAFGFRIQADQVGMQVRDIPELRAEIGELQTIDLDFSKSVSDDDDDGFFYDLRGSEGSGVLWVKVHRDAQGQHIVREARFRSAGGKAVELPIR